MELITSRTFSGDGAGDFRAGGCATTSGPETAGASVDDDEEDSTDGCVGNAGRDDNEGDA